MTHVLLGLLLMIVTTFIHATGMMLAFRVFHAVHVERWVLKNQLTKAGAVSFLVLWMFLLTLVESLLWAFTYFELGALPELDDALYFSAVTFTTMPSGAPKWKGPCQCSRISATDSSLR